MRTRLTILLILIAQLTFGQIQIQIPEPYGINFIESELIQEVSFIPLEMEEYGMVSPDMEMKIDKDDFFILDNKNKQCVYRFGNDGILINTIAEQKIEATDENIPVLNNPVKFNLNPYKQQIDIYNFEHSKIINFNYNGNKVRWSN